MEFFLTIGLKAPVVVAGRYCGIDILFTLQIAAVLKLVDFNVIICLVDSAVLLLPGATTAAIRFPIPAGLSLYINKIIKYSLDRSFVVSIFYYFFTILIYGLKICTQIINGIMRHNFIHIAATSVLE